MEYLGTYAGRVVSASDQLKIGRVQVRVPVLHGISGGPSTFVDDNDLPWALPAGLPAGGSPESGGLSWIPTVGDQVWVRLLDGDLAKPVWEWGNQNTAQIKEFGELPVNAYQSNSQPVRRAALTRYKHWIELLPDMVTAWTKSRYRWELFEGSGDQPDGAVSMTTARGYFLSIDDSNKTATLTAPSIEFTSKELTITASKSMELTTPRVTVYLGTLELGGDFKQFTIDAVRRTKKGLILKFNAMSNEIGGSTVFKTPSFYVTDGSVRYSDDFKPYEPDYGLAVKGDEVYLGKSADDPVVRLSDLKSAFQSLKQIFDSHVHTGVESGESTTATPASPLIMSLSASEKVVVEGSSKKTEILA